MPTRRAHSASSESVSTSKANSSADSSLRTQSASRSGVRTSSYSPGAASAGSRSGSGPAEAISGVQAPQLLHVRLTQGKLVVAHIQWHVQADRGELAVERQAVERRAPVLADLPLDGVGAGDHPVQVAVLGEPLGGGLGPALLDPGDVVDLVAHQGQVIDDLVRADAMLADHRFDAVQAAAAHGVHQADAGAGLPVAVDAWPHQL